MSYNISIFKHKNLFEENDEDEIINLTHVSGEKCVETCLTALDNLGITVDSSSLNTLIPENKPNSENEEDKNKPTDDAKTEETEQRAEVEREAANKQQKEAESEEESKNKFESTITELTPEEFMTQLMEQLRTFLK
jgi:hypothetical protein